jgi:hypothetical protein
MIQLQRVRTAKAIPKAFRGPDRIEKFLLLLEGRRAGTPEFDAKVWKAAKIPPSQEKSDLRARPSFAPHWRQVAERSHVQRRATDRAERRR